MKLFIVIPLLIVSLSCLAADKRPYPGKVLYRYKNEAGTTVLDSKIPPQYVKKGYQVLNNYGQLIDTIAPELTPEQLAERDAEAQRHEAAKKQAAKDKALLRMYSNTQDAQRVLENQTSAIDLKIAYLRSSIGQLQGKLDNEVARAANTERRGREVSPRTLEAIQSFREKIHSSEETILKHEQEKGQLKQDFSEIIARLKIIKPDTTHAAAQ